jgi:hypothetical protein
MDQFLLKSRSQLRVNFKIENIELCDIWKNSYCFEIKAHSVKINKNKSNYCALNELPIKK